MNCVDFVDAAIMPRTFNYNLSKHNMENMDDVFNGDILRLMDFIRESSLRSRFHSYLEGVS